MLFRLVARRGLVFVSRTSPIRRVTTIARVTIPEFIPEVMVLPIARRPLLPHATKNIVIKHPAVCETMVKVFESGQPYIGAFLTRDDDNESDILHTLDQIYRIGSLVQIVKIDKIGQTTADGVTAALLPHRRIRIQELLLPPPSPVDGTPGTLPYSSMTPEKESINRHGDATRALVSNLAEEPYSRKNPLIRALTSEILSTIKEIIRYNPSVKDQIAMFSYTSGVNLVEEPAMLADFAASLVLFGEPEEMQAVMESLVVEERMQKALLLLKKEVGNAKLQHQINAEVEEKMAKSRRDYYLLEQMKGIQKELGLESDGKEKLVQNFRDRAASLSMPKAVKTVFEEVYPDDAKVSK